MDDRKEFTVTYWLDQYQQQQLENILQAYKSKGLNFDSVESLFKSIMTVGSTYDVAHKLAFAEVETGISEYKGRDEVYRETKARLEKEKLREQIDAAVDHVVEQQQIPEPDLEMEL